MKNILIILLIIFSACSPSSRFIKENTKIEIYPYQDNGLEKAGAMPFFVLPNELIKYHYRFDYLLLNSPKIHQKESYEDRSKLFSIYPDTLQLRSSYLNNLIKDQKFRNDVYQSLSAIKHPARKRKIKFNKEEMMEIASLFFYCDEVNADSSITSHVCIGINGLNERPFERDYTLLAAFCYEAIFKDIEKDTSLVYETYVNEKKNIIELFKPEITSLEEYLIRVRKELFKRMKNNKNLKDLLTNYYLQNRNNLSFEIVDLI